MVENKEEQVMTYVSAMLYFYGVMRFDDLFDLVCERILKSITKDDLRRLLHTAVAEHRFAVEADCFYDLEVDDVDWVLSGQAIREELDYRFVSEEEARLVGEKKYPLLWKAEEKAFFHWLIPLCAEDLERAALLLLDYEVQIKNNVQLLTLAKNVVLDLNLDDPGNVRQVAVMVAQLYKNVPLWTLKGWTSADVLYED